MDEEKIKKFKSIQQKVMLIWVKLLKSFFFFFKLELFYYIKLISYYY